MAKTIKVKELRAVYQTAEQMGYSVDLHKRIGRYDYLHLENKETKKELLYKWELLYKKFTVDDILRDMRG